LVDFLVNFECKGQSPVAITIIGIGIGSFAYMIPWFGEGRSYFACKLWISLCYELISSVTADQYPGISMEK